jgi:HlyD family secretion protein
MKWVWVSIAIAFACLGGGVAWWRINQAVVPNYVTVAAARGDVVRTVTTTGTINPELTIMVGTYVSGVLQDLYCDFNTKVKVGQICAKIDPRPYQSIVDQAKATLGVAQAQLEKDRASRTYAQLNYERNLRLLKQDSVSKDATDLAKNNLDQAQAQVDLDQAMIDQRQAELDAAQVNLGYTNITSPVDGTVVSRNVTRGQTLAASMQTPTLFLIATDLTKMQVDTNISESDVGGIKEGDKATFTVDAYPRRVFNGTVTQARQSPQTVQNVVTFDAVVSVPNPDLALKPGMTAATRIIIDQANNVPRAPNQALRYAPGGLARIATREPGAGARLWVLRDNQAVPLDVVTGLEDENFTEIVKGDLRENDQIIVSEQPTSSGASTPAPRLR